MKRLQDYIAEESQRASGPVVGDDFAIVIQEDCLLETHVVDLVEGGIVVAADEQFLSLLESHGIETEEIRRYGAVGSNAAVGYTLEEKSADGKPDSDHELALIRSRAGLEEQNAASNDPVLAKAVDLAPVAPVSEDSGVEVVDQDYDLDQIAFKLTVDGKPVSFTYWDYDEDFGNADIEEIRTQVAERLSQLSDQQRESVARAVYSALKQTVAEAEYQGRDVELNKPTRGDVKKFKVYVKDPKTGNVKKVNFGDPNMRIKKSNPERRKSFRARHNCDNPGPKTKARYWSCRAW